MKPAHRNKNFSLKGLATTLEKKETNSCCSIKRFARIWSLINANGLKLILACDMKVTNIICGLQTHSSMNPCTWCDVKSKCFAKSGNLRTLSSIKSSLESFQ